MNKITITGNIGNDLELRYSGAGKAVLDIKVAVKRPFAKDKTDWFNVVVFDKQAENCANYLRKGSKVLVVGSMQFDTYDKQDGTKGYSNKLVAQEVEFLDSKKDVGFEPKGLGDEYTALESSDVPF